MENKYDLAFTMASKEGAAEQAFGPVLAAVATMQGNVSRSEKTNAHEFLEKFQKSVSLSFPLLLLWITGMVQFLTSPDH